MRRWIARLTLPFVGRLALAFCGGFVLPTTPRAHADVPAPRAVAEVTVAGSEDDMNSFLEALTEPLEGLGLHIRGGRAGEGDAPPAGDAPSKAEGDTGNAVLLWIDARGADKVDLFVEVTVGTKVRRVHRSIVRYRAATSSSITAEDVAYEARSTLEALLSTVPTPEPPPVRPFPPPPPVQPPAVSVAAPPAPLPGAPLASIRSLDGFSVDAALLANGRGFADSTVASGVTAAVDLAPWGRRPFRPSLWLSGSLEAPFETSPTLVALTTHLYGARVLPSLELARVGSVRLAAGAGFGLDFVRSDAATNDVSPISLAAPATYVDPILEAQIVLRARLFDRVGLLLAAAIDYDVALHDFRATDQSGGSQPVLSPWTVRPVGMLGLCVSLTGPSGCAGAP